MGINLEKRREACRKHYQENKIYYRRRNKLNRLKLRKLISIFKNRPCADCKIKYPDYVMDFDHVRGKKDFDISMAVNKGVSLQHLVDEIKKCDVVCSNCHRIRTFS